MDSLKNFAEGVKNKPSNSDQTQQSSTGQEDYGDKGLDAVEKKAGFGGKLNRDQNEKITDGARDAFEKGTGKNIPAKFSN